MHRLNVSEHDQTVRDLLQTDIRLSENFPSDDTAYGFDNFAAALNVTDAWASTGPGRSPRWNRDPEQQSLVHLSLL